MQKKRLTSRYLLRWPDLLASAPGLDMCLLSLLKSLGEFGRLGRSLLLQFLAFEDGVLQLLLDFGHPSFVLTAGGLLGF